MHPIRPQIVVQRFVHDPAAKEIFADLRLFLTINFTALADIAMTAPLIRRLVEIFSMNTRKFAAQRTAAACFHEIVIVKLPAAIRI